MTVRGEISAESTSPVAGGHTREAERGVARAARHVLRQRITPVVAAVAAILLFGACSTTWPTSGPDGGPDSWPSSTPSGLPSGQPSTKPPPTGQGMASGMLAMQAWLVADLYVEAMTTGSCKQYAQTVAADTADCAAPETVATWRNLKAERLRLVDLKLDHRYTNFIEGRARYLVALISPTHGPRTEMINMALDSGRWRVIDAARTTVAT